MMETADVQLLKNFGKSAEKRATEVMQTLIVHALLIIKHGHKSIH